MAITLRNKPAEELIKRIGRQRGLGPSAVIIQAVEAFAKMSAPALPAEEIARRKAFIEAFLAEMAAKTSDEDRRIAREIEADMYDENGLPK
ncbi:MAG: type II toxin-antitoxin system VapB family antitoxin [Proteobacteria bacterium]|nr:type II toxin-antitoxin system VapB family antitoxin [Pseudomonadota bacterium]